MIGLDTNVLVRLLTDDDPKQSAIARAYVARNCNPETPAFVDREVVLETVWVLESAYDYARSDIAAAVEAVLQAADLTVEASERVREALRAYRNGADFADAIIAAVNTSADCTFTVTFDKAAASKLPHFKLI